MTTHAQTRQLLPMYGLGTAAAALVAVAAIVRAAAATNTGWTRYVVMQRASRLIGPDEGADLAVALKDSAIGLTTAAVVPLLAGVVFLFWLYRARVNAEILVARPQRLGRGWTVGAWFVPLGNLVLPPLVVAGVWRASTGRSCGLVAAWWTAVLGACALDVYARFFSGLATMASAVAFTLEAVVTLIAGGLAIMIIRKISRAQREIVTE